MYTKSYPTTAAGKKRLEEELMYLKNEKQKELRKQIKEHRSYCDFSDNASFSQTLDQQTIVKDRIATIEEILLNIELIDSKDEQKAIVRLGSIVTFKELPDGIKETYTIVGTIEADPLENKISIDSTIGKNLLGSEKEDVVLIQIPSGEIKVKVLDVG